MNTSADNMEDIQHYNASSQMLVQQNYPRALVLDEEMDEEDDNMFSVGGSHSGFDKFEQISM
jgi:hypothetical protein